MARMMNKTHIQNTFAFAPFIVFILGWLALPGQSATLTLSGMLRDQSPYKFQPSDFEYKLVSYDRGIVSPIIGADRKPVYAFGNNPSKNGSVHNQDTFYTWFHDTPVTKNIPTNITLSNDNTGDARVFCHQNSSYFPLDNIGWGNENNPHNYHFCLEIHGRFAYKGGEMFDFAGDDDVFMYINDKLVIDIGGVHTEQKANVKLDDLG